LAPSATGWLHLGHARSFVLAWCHARSRGGRVVLRIEDLDRSRFRPEFPDAIRRDLEWLGLDWDGPVETQSEHAGRFQAALDRLAQARVLYPCTCTRADLEPQFAPHLGEDRPYPGTCAQRKLDAQFLRSARELKPVLRVRVEPGPIEIHDELLGAQSFDVRSEVGDFQVVGRDGTVNYQLAVVVDDAAAGVNEVVRGADLLPSAARQAWLQQLLGLPRPRWWHVSMVVDETDRRLAKRRSELTLAELRAAGVDPRAVVGWVAECSGQEAPPRLTALELSRHFDLQRLPRAPCRLAPGRLEQLRSALA
jgi:glutamyl-tRNA synthetase